MEELNEEVRTLISKMTKLESREFVLKCSQLAIEEYNNDCTDYKCIKDCLNYNKSVYTNFDRSDKLMEKTKDVFKLTKSSSKLSDLAWNVCAASFYLPYETFSSMYFIVGKDKSLELLNLIKKSVY